MLEVSRAMSAEHDLVRLLSLILDATKRLVRADRCSVFLVDAARDELWTQVAQDADPIRIPRGSGIVGAVVDSGEAINIADAYDHPRFNPDNDRRIGYRTRSVLCMPLIGRGDAVIGALQALNKREGEGDDGEFSVYDEDLLSALCAHAAVAIDTAQLIASDRERQRLQNEMVVARAIQQRLLPARLPVHAGWRLFAWQQPCEETGGDYHDVLVGERELDLIVGDVSGHGVGAALIMSTARASLRALHDLIEEPPVLIRRLNTILERDLADDAFMSLLLCRLGRGGSCDYVAAGHEPPLVYRSEAGTFDQLQSTGFLMGALGDVAYESVHVTGLDPGDLVVACTDGIFEVADPAGEQWGMERLRATIATHARSGGAAVVERIVAAVEQHLAGTAPADDLTLVVAQRLAVDISLLPDPAPERGEVVREWRCVSRIDRKAELIEELAGELLGRRWVAEEDRHWLHLVLEEVLVNAIFHGNEGDPALMVHLTLRRWGQRWELLVRDSGEGFSADCLPDPADPASLLLEHGRGLMIMHDWLDELSYHEEGRVALLGREIAAAGGDPKHGE
ncbi:MAG: ATP-binding SpoIIE family protein phosphatase [Planctomycetota bacterium]